MELEATREVKELLPATLRERSEEIAGICGTAIPYEIDLPSIHTLAEAIHFLDYLACRRLHTALRAICSDDAGREAVRKGLKRVRLRNVTHIEQMRMTFSAGVLEMHCAYEQGARGVHGEEAIHQLLLTAL